MNQTDHIRNLLNAEKYAVLCTLSEKIEGWPFGSLTPFALLATGEPVVLLSGLAEHTRNVLADARVSLFVQDSAALANPQAGARVTLLGKAAPVAEEQFDEARDCYLRRFPDAASLLQLGDFRFFKIHLSRARYIGGFGKMYWADGADLLNEQA